MKLRDSGGRKPSGRMPELPLSVLLLVLLPASYTLKAVSAVIHKSAYDLRQTGLAANDDHQPSSASVADWLSSGFELHDHISPTFHCPRTKRALTSSSLDDDGELHGDAPTHRRHRQRLILQTEGQRAGTMTLDLTLNENLLAEGYRLVSQTPEGRDVVQPLDRAEVELCHYEGSVRELPGSRVAVSTCDGAVEGVIYARNETFLIEHHNQTHLLYRRRRQAANLEMQSEEEIVEEEAGVKRNEGQNGGKAAFSAGYRENEDSLFVELALVVDRTLFLKFSSNLQRVHRHCLSVVNVLNELYRPLNVYVLLVGVVVWNTRDSIIISTDSRQTLTSFLAYRRDRLLTQLPNDNAHLLTAVRFPDGVIGKAELGSMCSAAGSGGLAVVETFAVTPLATTLAHEIGHSFNIEHDADECASGGPRCPGPGPCIMEAKLRDTGDAPHRWSACSVDDLRESLSRGLGACLRNRPERLLVRAVCGNGLLEPGEQCDCGRTDRCDNACCEASTCQLRANATCATGACCDLGTCQPRSPGTPCRAAIGECDLPEFCDGQSELCPRDVFVRDASTCAKGTAYCLKGHCHTHDSQCRLLWGPSARSGPDVCYETNVNGSVYGHCGSGTAKDSFEACARPDVHCGLLHCTHRSEKLEYGMEAYARRTATRFQHYGPRGTVRSTVCNAALVDLGPAVRDPGLVPDGTKCGHGRMCFRQQCIPIGRLQEERDLGDACTPEDCNGHGVCNSEGHCHCEPGFAPPFCDQPGVGGSIDSGPATGTLHGNSRDLLLKVFLPVMTIGALLCVLSLGLLVVKRDPLTAHLRLVLKRFRERKYGHIVHQTTTKPSRPTGPISPPLPPPPPPPPATTTAPRPPQCFINVNISKNGKVTIENKLLTDDSPFLHHPSVVDTQEAFRMRRLQERSCSVESTASSDRPLVQAETHEPAQPSSRVDRMHAFQDRRTKSDERPPQGTPRMLPKLPRQHTVGDFDTIERLPDEEPTGKVHQPRPIAIPKPLPRTGSTQPRLLPATPAEGQVRKGVKPAPSSGSNVAALKAKLNLAEVGPPKR